MFDSYIGLGLDCEVVVQLRRLMHRLTGGHQGHVLDWYLTSHEALIHVLRTDFADHFQLENLVVTDDGRFVSDTATGLLVRHLFSAEPDGTIPPEQVARDYPQLRARADHLLRRWRGTADPAKTVLYVRRDPDGYYTPEQLLEVRDALRERGRGHRFVLLWVRDPAASGAEALDGTVAELAEGLYATALPVPQPRAVHWYGDRAAWDRLFPKLSQLRPLAPARTAP